MIEMRTATLEPETIIPTKGKSKTKNKSSSTNVNLADLSNLIDDHNNLPKFIHSGDSLMPNIRAIPDSNEWKTVSKKGSKNQKKLSFSSEHGSVDDMPELNSSTTKNNSKSSNNKSTLQINENLSIATNMSTNECGQPITTDPVKRLRNLRKKLKEIESLKLKQADNLEKEQLDKIKRENEILEQIEQLAKQVGEL